MEKFTVCKTTHYQEETSGKWNLGRPWIRWFEQSVKAQNRYNGTKPSEEEEGRIKNSYHVSFYGELLLAPT